MSMILYPYVPAGQCPPEQDLNSPGIRTQQERLGPGMRGKRAGARDSRGPRAARLMMSYTSASSNKSQHRIWMDVRLSKL